MNSSINEEEFEVGSDDECGKCNPLPVSHYQVNRRPSIQAKPDPEAEKDFKKAYLQLATNLTEKDPSIVPTQDLIKFPSTARGKSKSKEFYDRASEFAETVKKRIESAKKAKEGLEMQECTFAPKTTRQSERRNLNDFLKAQNEYLDKKKQNLSRLSETSKSRFESSLMQCPKINEKSRALIERRNSTNEPVHQRLFERSKKHLPLPGAEETTEIKERPKRTGRELALYEDAKRRQAKALMHVNASNHKKVEPVAPSTDPHVIQRFRKEYYRIINELGLKNGTLTFDQIGRILVLGGFVRRSGKLEESPSLEQKMWQILEGEGGVASESLLAFLAAVLNIRISQKNGLSQTQVMQIHKEFYQWYANKNSSKCKKDNDKENMPTFMPALCEQSLRMATKNRPSRMEEHTMILIKTKEQQEKKRLALKKEIEEEELKECTFRPQISTRSYRTSRPDPERCSKLYELAKKIEKREDKRTDEYFFEKSPHEYTFTPRLLNTTKPVFNLKQAEKKEFYKNQDDYFEEPVIKPEVVHEEDSKPLLYIDVTLRGTQERIIVHHEDTPESLAAEFAAEHRMKEKLERLIRMQIEEEQAVNGKDL